jgi:hypothetical protein
VVFSSLSEAVAALPIQSDVGVRKPVMFRKKVSSESLVEVTETETFCGTGSGFFVQPAGVGV